MATKTKTARADGLLAGVTVESGISGRRGVVVRASARKVEIEWDGKLGAISYLNGDLQTLMVKPVAIAGDASADGFGDSGAEHQGERLTPESARVAIATTDTPDARGGDSGAEHQGERLTPESARVAIATTDTPDARGDDSGAERQGRGRTPESDRVAIATTDTPDARGDDSGAEPQGAQDLEVRDWGGIGWIETYRATGTARGTLFYFRFVWWDANLRQRHQHIPGGNINSELAQQRAAQVERMLGDRAPREQILDAIASWRRGSGKSDR